MPPTFAYAMGFILYAAGTGGVLLLSALLALSVKTRPAAIRLALGALWSFPSMIAHQILAFPGVIMMILLGSAAFSGGQNMERFVGIPLLFLSIIWFATASAYGIIFGYQFIWRIRGGETVSHALDRNVLLRQPFIRNVYERLKARLRTVA